MEILLHTINSERTGKLYNFTLDVGGNAIVQYKHGQWDSEETYPFSVAPKGIKAVSKKEFAIWCRGFVSGKEST